MNGNKDLMAWSWEASIPLGITAIAQVMGTNCSGLGQCFPTLPWPQGKEYMHHIRALVNMLGPLGPQTQL